jgi:hypothetical protein
MAAGEATPSASGGLASFAATPGILLKLQASNSLPILELFSVRSGGVHRLSDSKKIVIGAYFRFMIATFERFVVNAYLACICGTRSCKNVSLIGGTEAG